MYRINTSYQTKLLPFRGENCNTNFGETARSGTNSVFAKLKTSNLKMKIQGKGSTPYIFHNAIQTSADILN
jgi:hypothetical protein